MHIEIGDRVQFKASLPDQAEPTLQHHVGWQGEPGNSEPITRTWSEHFGGQRGVVTSLDVTNREAIVRGRDGDGHDFTIQIGVDYLAVTEQGVPR